MTTLNFITTKDVKLDLPNYAKEAGYQTYSRNQPPMDSYISLIVDADYNPELPAKIIVFSDGLQLLRNINPAISDEQLLAYNKFARNLEDGTLFHSGHVFDLLQKIKSNDILVQHIFKRVEQMAKSKMGINWQNYPLYKEINIQLYGVNYNKVLNALAVTNIGNAEMKFNEYAANEPHIAVAIFNKYKEYMRLENIAVKAFSISPEFIAEVCNYYNNIPRLHDVILGSRYSFPKIITLYPEMFKIDKDNQVILLNNYKRIKEVMYPLVANSDIGDIEVSRIISEYL